MRRGQMSDSYVRANLLRSTLGFAIVVGLAGCKSCDDKAGGAGPTTSATACASMASASASGSAGRPRMAFGAGGPVGAFFLAADEADLKPEQKTTVEDIKKGIHGEGAQARDEAKGFRDELEAQVKVGKIDNAKL